MTVHARSDLAYISISEAHGGCGRPHSRPVVNGEPAKLWSLTCSQCEDHLRGDPLWSTTISGVPETLDERLAREDFEHRGARDERRIMTLALAKLAGVELPATIRMALDGTKAHIPATLVCPQGHENAPGQKFCGECGSPMHGAPADRQIASPSAPQEPSAPSRPASPADGGGDGDGALAALLALHPRKLASMCAMNGLDATGKVPELAARLHDAGVRAA